MKPGRLELKPEWVRQELKRFLEEDVGSGDVTTRSVVPPEAVASGGIVAREACVLAGMNLAREVFHLLDGSIQFDVLATDGTSVQAGEKVASVRGPAAPILTGERLALNLLQRLSGIATLTRRYVESVAGTHASVSDTRKTTPGLRLLEKYAVYTGGGRNHRIGLFDAVLIKDNHIAIAGGVGPALERARTENDPPIQIQIEVESLEQLREVLDFGADAVLLDNMPPRLAAEAVSLVRAHPRGATCWVEASGGITLQNIRAYAQAGVDTISVGALTHSAPAVDLALDLDPPGGR